MLSFVLVVFLFDSDLAVIAIAGSRDHPGAAIHASFAGLFTISALFRLL